jgi:hypothetical protein
MIIFIFVTLHSFSSISQQTPSDGQQVSKQSYLSKSKQQRKVATILLGTGAGLMIIAAVYPKGELVSSSGFCGPGSGILCNKDYKNDKLKSALFIAGGVSAVASVPFFIAAKKNRRRAASVGMKIQDVEFYKPMWVAAVSTKLHF